MQAILTQPQTHCPIPGFARHCADVHLVDVATHAAGGAVTAGNAEYDREGREVLNRIPFRYSGKKGNVDGEIIIIPTNIYNQAASLQLMDNAQANLRSLININAVNSPIQVLMNLNINVNSNIGNLNQMNNLLSR